MNSIIKKSRKDPFFSPDVFNSNTNEGIKTNIKQTLSKKNLQTIKTERKKGKIIKIIHFVPSINCTSGIMQLLMNYYRKMDRKIFKFEFVYFVDKTPNNFEKEIENLGGYSIKISSPVNYFKFKKDLNSYFKNRINKSDNSIFHNHQIAFTIFLKSIAYRNNIKYFIVHNHMTKYSDKFFSKIRNYLLCIPIKYMHLIYFACSKDASKLCFGKNKVYIMQNGISLNEYRFKEEIRNNYRKKFGISNNEFIIGHIGRFEPVKNHEMIFNIFEECLKYSKSIRLVLVGTGTLKNNYVKYVKDHNLEKKVIFLENRTDIPSLLCMLDCFIFPSKFEGLGIACIEAEASGLPIVISDAVPKEVQIHNCKVLSIENSTQYWVNEVVNIRQLFQKYDRTKSIEYLEKTVFNIDNNIKLLSEEYKNILESR